MSNKQLQRSGADSTNIQAQTINFGPSYTEVRDIALDVFRNNFIRLSEEAYGEIRRRVEVFTDDFLRALHERAPEAIENARHPDMQRALFNAQQEYACSGDDELAGVLLDMLVDRASQTERSLRQLVLNEALVTAPKLTNAEIMTLSLIFFMRRVKLNPSMALTMENLRTSVTHFLAPLAGAATGDADMRHLEYAGCISISMGEIGAASLYLQAYPGFFSKGVNVHSIRDELLSAFAPYPDSESLYYVPVADREMLQQYLEGIGMLEYENEINNLMSSNRMTSSEVLAFMGAEDAAVASLLERWDTTSLKHAEISSVGLAIGHANLQRVTDFKTDLGVWIK